MNKNFSDNINNPLIEIESDFIRKSLNLVSKKSFGNAVKMNSLVSDSRISYESGDFRKKFDLFIKNINEQTKNNLIDCKRRRSEGLNISSPKANSVKNSHKKT